MKKYSKEIQYIALLFLLCLGSVILLRKCDKKISSDYKKDTSVAPPVRVSKDADGKSHNLQDVEKIKDQAVTIELLKAENSRLKNFQTKADIGIKTREIPPKTDTFKYAVHDTIKDSNAISVPKHLRDSSKYYKVVVTIYKRGWQVDTLEHYDSLSVQFGQPRDSSLKERVKHIFKKSPITAEVILYNPNSYISGLRTFSYQPDKTFWQKNTTWFGAGVISVLAVEGYLYLRK